MATKPQQGSASALPTFDPAATVGQKVVRLPTASRRKVEQRWNRDTREVAFALRDQWPGQYIPGHVREKLEQAKLIDTVEASPALALAMALFQSLPEAERRRVMMVIECGAAFERPCFAQVSALLRRDGMTIGDLCSLDAALRIIRGEDAQ